MVLHSSLVGEAFQTFGALEWFGSRVAVHMSDIIVLLSEGIPTDGALILVTLHMADHVSTKITAISEGGATCVA